MSYLSKYLLVATLVVGFASKSMSQQKLIDRKGSAHFFSEAPLENIEATNNEAIGAIDLESGSVAVTMYIKGFHFDKSLMEEHFNENYLESDKYPKATFSGKIDSFSDLDFTKPGTIEATVDGTIEMHGVKKSLKTVVNFIVMSDKIVVKTKFDLAVTDFNIKVPKLLYRNIAESVQVTSLFNFSR